MLHRGLTVIAFMCCAIVVASFGMFAIDQMGGASKHQQSQLAAGLPTSPGVTPPSHRPGQPRRFIDDAARTLSSPFRSIVQSDNAWVVAGVPTVFALAAYGLGLGFLARFTRGMS